MVHGEKIKTPLKLIFTHTVMLDFGLDGAIQIGCGITDMVMGMYGDMDIITIGLDLSLTMADFMTPLTHFMDIIIHFIMDTDIHIIITGIFILTTILTITIITIIGVTAMRLSMEEEDQEVLFHHVFQTKIFDLIAYLQIRVVAFSLKGSIRLRV